jgi:hypothetical protein
MLASLVLAATLAAPSPVAIVFSPDLSVPGNCDFYSALGFACFEDTDWTRVLDAIRDRGDIRLVVLETHGTNGHGLKLQRDKDPQAERSYISVGALEERLSGSGVEAVIIAACNSGRLLRGSIYRRLDPDPGDKLFLPATCGIVDASASFDPEESTVRVLTPSESRVEMTIIGSIGELPPALRRALAGGPLPQEFAISDFLMRMIARPDTIALRPAHPVDALSRDRTTPEESEALYREFLGVFLGVRPPLALFSTYGGELLHSVRSRFALAHRERGCHYTFE